MVIQAGSDGARHRAYSVTVGREAAVDRDSYPVGITLPVQTHTPLDKARSFPYGMTVVYF